MHHLPTVDAYDKQRALELEQRMIAGRKDVCLRVDEYTITKQTAEV